MADEETRAADWRAQQVRRARFLRDNAIRLRGSTSARRLLEDRWAAVINRTRPDATPEEISHD